jgi:hypothetical protein
LAGLSQISVEGFVQRHHQHSIQQRARIRSTDAKRRNIIDNKVAGCELALTPGR